MPVSFALDNFVKNIGRKKTNDMKDTIKNTTTKTIGILMYKEIIAQKNEANTKLRKNIDGVNISKIRNSIPQIPKISHKCISNLLYVYNNKI